MPRRPPAEPIDHHYNIPKLNRVFFATGAVLALVFVWMVYADYKRDWKTVQRVFQKLDARKTREAALKARAEAYGAERARLLRELRAARADVQKHQKALARDDRKRNDLAPKIYLADQQYKFTKASFDAALYKYESSLANRPKSAPSAKKDLDALRAELERSTVRLAALKREDEETQADIQRITARRDEARDEHRQAVRRLQARPAEVRGAQAGHPLRGCATRRSST